MGPVVFPHPYYHPALYYISSPLSLQYQGSTLPHISPLSHLYTSLRPEDISAQRHILRKLRTAKPNKEKDSEELKTKLTIFLNPGVVRIPAGEFCDVDFEGLGLSH